MNDWMQENGSVFGGGVSANLCCPALPSLGPESSPEQLAALERKLCCLEQEKMELSRKLQGTGRQPDQGSGSDPGLLPPDQLLSCGFSRCRGPADPLRPSGTGAATEGSADPTGQAVRYPYLPILPLPPTLTLEADLLSQHP